MLETKIHLNVLNAETTSIILAIQKNKCSLRSNILKYVKRFKETISFSQRHQSKTLILKSMTWFITFSKVMKSLSQLIIVISTVENQKSLTSNILGNNLMNLKNQLSAKSIIFHIGFLVGMSYICLRNMANQVGFANNLHR